MRGIRLLPVTRAMRGREGVGAQRQALLVAEPGRQRVGQEADAREHVVDQRAQAVGGQVLAAAVLRDEADGVQARAPDLGACDAEPSRELAAPVQEQLRARRKLRQVGLVEPDGGLPHALAVDDDALDELQVPAPGRAHADALEGAPHGCLLARGEVAEAPDLLPVEVRAGDVLGKVADRADAELGQPFGDLRADPGDRLDGGVGVDAWAPGGRCVAASRKPGGRGGYGSPSQ